MKEIFKNKRICFLGDSITQHGYYIDDMRWYIRRQTERCCVYNRGIGGNRSSSAQPLMEYEIFQMRPDYCFISFGLNDMGIWLYDSFLTVTQEILQKRALRDETYFNGIKEIVRRCKERSVKPVIMSPCAVNELLVEKADIPTLADNKEKEDFIGPWFYKRKTFQNLNRALQGYALRLKEIAQEENCLCLDMFEKTYTSMLKEDGLFKPDGIHYTIKGHAYIAKFLLEYLGYQNAPACFESDMENDEIAKLQSIERDTAFARFNVGCYLEGKVEEDRLAYAREVVDNKNKSDWIGNVFQHYLEYYGRFDRLQDEIIKMTEAYLEISISH